MEKVEDDRGTLKQALVGDLGKKKKKQQKGEEDERGSIERSDNDEELRKIIGKKD